MKSAGQAKALIVGFFALSIAALSYFALSASHGDNTVHMSNSAHQDSK
jgi:hypothetical protein